jgi:hypothetical protein
VKDSLDHFEVKVEKDTLLHGESSQITVLAKDAENNNIELDGNTKLTLTIDSTHYGSFINATGDTVQSPLTNVLYSDAKNGKTKFTANKTNPIGMEPRRVIIKAVKADDISKSGKDSVYVKRKVVVKIQEHSPWTIWPDLANKTSKSGVTGYNPKRSFIIKVLDGLNKPIIGESIEIEATYKDSSGGHQHTDPRLKQDDQGKFYAQRKTGNPLKLATQDSGIVKIDSLIASVVSGEYLIYARSVKDTTIQDTVNLIVKVPNLLNFTGAGRYSLTGSKPKHPDNHYIFNQNAMDTLIKAAEDFASVKWNKTGNMRINENSLKWGGLFDKDSNWKTPHNLHRIGRSVDVENIALKDTTVTFVIKGQKVTKKVRVADKDWLKLFKDLMNSYKWGFEDEGQTIPNEEGSVLYPHFEWKGN